MNIYQQQILDNYHNPMNFGKPDRFTHSQKLENLSCGDEIEMFFTVDEDDNIAAAHFDGRGCAISIAAASLLTEELTGKKIHDVSVLTEAKMLELLGIELTTSRLKCALLSLDATKHALKPTLDLSS